MQLIQNCSIRNLQISDIALMVESFAKVSWPKPHELFESYFQEQQSGECIIWIAQL